MQSLSSSPESAEHIIQHVKVMCPATLNVCVLPPRSWVLIEQHPETHHCSTVLPDQDVLLQALCVECVVSRRKLLLIVGVGKGVGKDMDCSTPGGSAVAFPEIHQSPGQH